MALRFSRYKPVGWRGDSHRHYLASKGIVTKQATPLQRRFFASIEQVAPDLNVGAGLNDGPADAPLSSLSSSLGPNDAAKGNRSSSNLHRAFSRGHSIADLRRSSELREEFGVGLDELEKPKRTQFSVGLTNRQEGIVEPSFPKTIGTSSVEEVVASPITAVQEAQTQEASLNIPVQTVMTPGIPTRESSFDVGGPP